MKALITFLLALAITTTVIAQPPQTFQYQAVLRSLDGKALANQDVEIDISIIQGNINGVIVFTETHNNTTNAFGLVNLQIASANPSAFKSIDWGTGPYFIQISVDGEIIGTSQLLSVPYALHAATVEFDEVNDADADPTNELQDISFSNGELSISKGSSIPLSSILPKIDTSNTNELQDISLSGNELSISNGSTVILPDQVNDADADPLNEIQILSINADTIFLSNGGYVKLPAGFDGDFNSLGNIPPNLDTDCTNDFDGQYSSLSGTPQNLGDFNNDAGFITSPDDADADPANELQFLSINGDTIFLSNGGYVKLPAGFDGDFNSLGNIPPNLDTDCTNDFDGQYSSLSGTPQNLGDFNNDAGFITSPDDADADPANELQLLSINGDTIFLSNGGYVKLPAGFNGDFNSLRNIPPNLDTDATDDFDGQYSSLAGAPQNVSEFNNDAGYITSPDDADANPTNEIQDISLSGHQLSISGGSSVFLPDEVNDNDADPTNELQQIWYNNGGIYLSQNGGFAKLPDETDPVFKASLAKQITVSDTTRWGYDSSPLNEIQALSISHDTIFLSNGGYVKLPAGSGGDFNSLANVPPNLDTDYTDDFDGQYNSLAGAPQNVSAFNNDAGYITSPYDNDADPANEIQLLSINIDTIFLSNGGYVKLPAAFSGDFNSLVNIPPNLDTDDTDDFDGQYNSLAGAPQNVSAFNNDAGYITSPDDNDADPANEIQLLSINIDTIFLSNGGYVKLPAAFSGDFNSLVNIPPNLDTDDTDDFDGQYNSLAGAPQNVSAFNNDAGYITSPDDADADPANELQALSINVDTIFLSNGGYVKLPAAFNGDFNSLVNIPPNLDTDDTDDFDGQYSSLAGTPQNVSVFNNDAGYITSPNDADADPANEIQLLSINGDTIFLSNGGYVKLPAAFNGDFNSLLNIPPNLDTDDTDDFDGQYSSLAGAPQNVSTFNNDAGYITSPDDNDADPANEIQVLSISNDTIYLSNGGKVKLPAETDPEVGPNTTNRIPKWNGNSLVSGTIFDNDSIGIGTSAPVEKLDVNGNIKGDTVYAHAFSGNSPLLLQTSGTTRIFVDDSNGNVGIGTSSPEEKLEVNGAVVIGNNSSDSPKAGTIRWNPDTNDFEGFNGTEWKSLTAGSTSSGNEEDLLKITASDGDDHDNFGRSVSISGDYAIVGAPAKNNYTGAAYIFQRSGTGWVQQAILTSNDIEQDDSFGMEVCISGDYAIVGTLFKNNFTGAAYIFHRSETSWTQQAKLDPSDVGAGDEFGSSVCISGDYAIVGASDANDGFEAYIFHRSETSWTQQDRITATYDEESVHFATVSISGDYAIVGVGGEGLTGAAYIFQRIGTVWLQQAKLRPPNVGENDYFGIGVSISGDYAIIGASYKDYGTGAAFIFQRTGTEWFQQAELTAADGADEDYFGEAVCISGDYAIVGAPGKYNNTGVAYLFQRTGTSWVQLTRLSAADRGEFDLFGVSVSVSDGCAIVGAPGKNNGTGAAYFY